MSKRPGDRGDLSKAPDIPFRTPSSARLTALWGFACACASAPAPARGSSSGKALAGDDVEGQPESLVHVDAGGISEAVRLDNVRERTGLAAASSPAAIRARNPIRFRPEARRPPGPWSHRCSRRRRLQCPACRGASALTKIQSSRPVRRPAESAQSSRQLARAGPCASGAKRTCCGNSGMSTLDPKPTSLRRAPDQSRMPKWLRSAAIDDHNPALPER